MVVDSARGAVTLVTSCRHCGLPVNEADRRRGARFCCAGCEAVHALITSEGLQDFYRFKPAVTAPPLPRHADSYAWFDALAGPGTGGVRTHELDLEGIHCSACTWLLRRLLARHAGGVDLRINSTLGRARLVWNEAEGDPRAFLADAARYGYRFGPPRRTRANGDRPLLLRLGLSVALAMNAMIFMLPFHLGLTREEAVLTSFFGWLAFLLTTGVVAIGGSLFIGSAWRSLRLGVLHFDVPVALGITLAYAGSVWTFATRGASAAYFDTVAAFVALMVVGRWLQAHVVARNRRLLLDETGVESLFTRRITDGGIASIRATEVVSGDVLLVSPGDVVPVDARAEEPGRFSLDWITGESRPRRYEAGEGIPAGAFNSGRTPVRVSATGSIAESPLPELLSAPDAETPVRDAWWERLSRVYVIGVVGVAAGASIVWSLLDPARIVSVAVAVLVVSCPCAFGIAVPLARELVASRLRRHGVFLRRLDVLDRLTRVRRVVFDKTGTLTHGAMVLSVESVGRVANLPEPDREALRHIAFRNNHPVCRSLAELFPPVEERESAGGPVVEVPGQGVAWRSAGGALYRLGRRRFALPGGTAGEGRERAVLSKNGALLATFTFDEAMRADVKGEIARLRDAGYGVHILSGDEGERVARAAAAVGIDPACARGSLSPEAKASLIGTLDEPVFMVGDGVNDTPGFRAAIASAAPLSRHGAAAGVADAFYIGEGIRAVGNVLAYARRLRRVTHETLAIALFYNALLVSMAVMGHVTPVVAAVAMPVSSIMTALFVLRRTLDGRVS